MVKKKVKRRENDPDTAIKMFLETDLNDGDDEGERHGQIKMNFE